MKKLHLSIAAALLLPALALYGYSYRYRIFYGANLRVDVKIYPPGIPESSKVPGTNRVIITDAGVSCATFIGDTFNADPPTFEVSPSRVWEQWCTRGGHSHRHYSAMNLPLESDEDGRFTIWLKLYPSPTEAPYYQHPERYASAGIKIRTFVKYKDARINDYMNVETIVSPDHWVANWDYR